MQLNVLHVKAIKAHGIVHLGACVTNDVCPLRQEAIGVKTEESRESLSMASKHFSIESKLEMQQAKPCTPGEAGAAEAESDDRPSFWPGHQRRPGPQSRCSW